jgi:peptide/nickel transport system ATP-binding protein
VSDAGVILEGLGLVKHFGGGRHLFWKSPVVHAVDDVSIAVNRQETFAIVGESGCGKSTLGRLLLRLIEATAGRVVFEGRDLRSLGAAELRELRRDMQIIFQDPFSSLNPRMTVADIVGEPLRVHGVGSRSERLDRVRELLDLVGLSAAFVRRYPHEFSGGQRQRIGIARALALQPKLLVCDEPVSACSTMWPRYMTAVRWAM